MNEVWRQVPGFEEIIEASSEGRLRSIPRMVVSKRWFRGRRVNGCVLTPALTSSGYLKVTIYAATGRVTASVHRLICAAFHGPAPSPEHQTNHKDGDKRNNIPSNLEWVTAQENSQHAIGCLGKGGGGERNHNCRLSANDIAMIVSERQNGTTCRALAETFGITVAHVSRIATGQSWTMSGLVPTFVPNEQRANRRGSFNGRTKLTEDVVREIRRRHGSGEKCNDLAGEYGLSKSAMFSLCRGHTWKHVR